MFSAVWTNLSRGFISLHRLDVRVTLQPLDESVSLSVSLSEPLSVSETASETQRRRFSEKTRHCCRRPDCAHCDARTATRATTTMGDVDVDVDGDERA